MRLSPVEMESHTLAVGRSTYKLTYASKLSIACGRQHSGVLNKISRYITGFSNSPGFILQKQNESFSEDAVVVGGKRSKPSTPNAMGASRNITSQFIPLSTDMAGAIFDKAYVESMKGYVEEEIELGAGTDGCYEERSADKTACRYNPPYTAQKQRLGTLLVGTGFSNFNILRHASSDGDFQFEGDDGPPQLLCQITMADSKADPASPPMVRFSAPSSEMIAILECEQFRKMIEARMPDATRSDTPRPRASSKPEPIKAKTVSASDSE